MNHKNSCLFPSILRRLWLPLLSLLLSACASNTHSALYSSDNSQEINSARYAELYKTCSPDNAMALASVVRVANFDTEGGDGSGVVIAPNVVLTAAHVLDHQESGLVYIGSQYKKAMVLGRDTSADLALLMVGTENIEPIPLSRRGLRSNEAVWAVGYPLALAQSTTYGEFLRYRNGGLLTTAEIDAGSSGGGLLHCENGQVRVAGMIRSYMAYYKDGVPVRLPGRSIAVPASAIEAFVALHGLRR